MNKPFTFKNKNIKLHFRILNIGTKIDPPMIVVPMT